MSKKKISKKREFTLKELQPIKTLHDLKLREAKPEEYFKNHKIVAEALLQCLIENDSEAFMEILDSYLRVNRTQIAKKADLPRSTVSGAFSKKGNPTIKTIAKIVSEAAIFLRK